MAIQLTFPATGYSIQDLTGIIDFIAVEATISGFTPVAFNGSGTYAGLPGSFTATGTGFSMGVIGGESYITSGVIDTVTFTSAAGTVSFEQLGGDPIDLSVLSPIIYADEHGTDPLGIEEYLLQKDWIITLGDADDAARRGSTIGDGADFNLRGNDLIHGSGGNDILYSGDGRDKVYGDTGRDRLMGGAGNDQLVGGSGKDTLLGGSGRDRLVGGGGNDKLFGGNGDDMLNGGGRKDVLVGGRGDDILTGGARADRFVFSDNCGNDTITDFNAIDNREEIDLSDVSRITSYRDLVRNHMQQVGDNVVIDDHAGTTITLLNADIGDLHVYDFLF